MIESSTNIRYDTMNRIYHLLAMVFIFDYTPKYFQKLLRTTTAIVLTFFHLVFLYSRWVFVSISIFFFCTTFNMCVCLCLRVLDFMNKRRVDIYVYCNTRAMRLKNRALLNWNCMFANTILWTIKINEVEW